MERLEARICELAGHLTAATCQFLLLIADFDARKTPQGLTCQIGFIRACLR